MQRLPKLYVEGVDDVSIVNSLLHRHGLDTKSGALYLEIINLKDVDTLLDNIPDAIKAATDFPIGFVLDIDVLALSRWEAVCSRLREINIDPPGMCPATGYFDRLHDYPNQFGIWMMPDCKSDHLKIENLCKTLVRTNDPLWAHAEASVRLAANIIDQVNSQLGDASIYWKRFRDVDRIKAEIHSWLSWQERPGIPLGGAIKACILGHDSVEAIAFLRWLKSLYGFSQLSGV